MGLFTYKFNSEDIQLGLIKGSVVNEIVGARFFATEFYAQCFLESIPFAINAKKLEIALAGTRLCITINKLDLQDIAYGSDGHALRGTHSLHLDLDPAETRILRVFFQQKLMARWDPNDRWLTITERVEYPVAVV